jgi:uncharacterized protein with von Willebrand factor type A (vWA) domain
MTDDRIVDFVGLLRQNGLRVSPGEAADAARALALVPFDQRDTFRAALRATLVKRGQDVATFDRIFEVYFGGIGRLLEGLEESIAAALSPDGLSIEELQAIAGELATSGAISPLTSALVQGNAGELARLLRAAALRVDFRGLGSSLQRGFYARRVMAALGVSEAAADLPRFEEALRTSGLDPGAVERFSARLSAALEALEDTARQAADLEHRVRDREALTQVSEAALHRAIATLSPQDLKRMRDVVKRLAERLKSRLARRRRERRRGELNVRRTLRKNLGLGGFPAQLAFRRRRPERPDIVLLCDVSDSVRNVSRLMLQFVHTLQALYARVRSFVFVSDLGEVTGLFKEARVEDAIDGAIAARVINLSANSNYGNALLQFNKDFRGSVTRRTTVVVIGDGRSNYNPPQAWVVRDLKQKARRVVWLCPEDRANWGFGDSEMTAYARYCHQVFVVHTVDDLGRAAERLLP